ncbi:MAG: TIGR01777 family oxidoreductase [Polyangiaceae bacterium]
MRVLVTGGTGFIGRALVAQLLARGDEVTGLTRRVPAVADAADVANERSVAPRVRWVAWDPERAGEWQRELSGHDAVVHLAGASAVGRRYTEQVRREILESRVEPTRRLVEGIGALPAEQRPRVLVCASGVGFYGARGDEEVDEWAEAGHDFLAEVCVAWEAAARAAEAHGVRVVNARIGFVLGRGGGALAKLVPIFKAFAGGKLGSGRQWMPWIHLDDVVGALLLALSEASLSGPMNVAGPSPATNAEFSKALGRALKRPALFPVPAFGLRALFGDGAEPLLTGQRAVPRALLTQRYRFRFSELDAALADLPGLGALAGARAC